jgi:alpha,alpha-trehalase
VRRLAETATVAIVSGRDRADVQGRVRIDGIFYAGSHGLDIAGPDRELTQPEAEAAVPEVEEAERRLREAVDGIDGAVIERKRFSVAAHYRMVADDEVEAVRRAAGSVLEASPHLRARTGKKVVELVPAIDWDKGRAVAWLLNALGVDPGETLVLYVGDDETDEDAFHVLSGSGLGLHVGDEVSDSLGDFRLADPAAVQAFLRTLAGD